jgi:hypothetical protein
MSCSCGDPYCDGYYCNNSGGGAFLIIIVALLYPYLPFMIIGYEFMDKLGNGMNFIKWLGAIAGFVLGFFLYFKWLEKIILEIFNIQSRILYWIIVYILASFMFLLIKPIYRDNHVIKIVVDLWSKFFIWALASS